MSRIACKQPFDVTGHRGEISINKTGAIVEVKVYDAITRSRNPSHFRNRHCRINGPSRMTSKSVATSSYDPFRFRLYALTAAAWIAARFVSKARSRLASSCSAFGCRRFSASSVTKNDHSIARSWPQNRMAHRVGSKIRLWFGKLSIGVVFTSVADSMI